MFESNIKERTEHRQYVSYHAILLLYENQIKEVIFVGCFFFAGVNPSRPFVAIVVWELRQIEKFNLLI